MRRDISALANKEYDLIVVGGGIFGICAAWDAALRGLSVALIEQGDFGHATSANHFKVVHGGIRYLQHADIPRIRESSAERSALLRIAPHLVHPMPFVIPTYGHGMESREAMTAALIAYDLCTFDRNRGIKDPTRHIPRGHTISRTKTLEMFPQLNDKGLTGAAIFHDGQMYNPPRLSLAIVQSAAEAGADVANYAEVVQFLRDDKRVTGVAVNDRLTGDEFEVRGRVVLNATGPWAKWLLGNDQALDLERKPSFSRDAYFVVKRKLVDQHALAIQGQTKDPDAVLSRGNRHLFMVPWRDYTLVGVWHVVFNGRPEDFTVTAQDLQGFIDEVNVSYPGIDLSLDDVTMWNAGLTLFGENAANAKDLSYGKRSILLDHAKEHGIEGLISLIGVRFTTARGMAEKAVNMVQGKLGNTVSQTVTEHTPAYGGDFELFDDLIRGAEAQLPSTASAKVATSLAHNHGSHYGDILKYADENPVLIQCVNGSPILKAEVVHAARAEMAEKLSDIVFRRTDLGTGSHPGAEALEVCAALMAAEKGWNSERKERELAEVEAAFPRF
ncbi:MAG: glycerol-3-phosphate dehydrogenase/oxidase [Caldilineaceae bacterium]|nr:glycerol-3-phosphate dehydrogenase/oxidase [Caldilineaceae bacterium]